MPAFPYALAAVCAAVVLVLRSPFRPVASGRSHRSLLRSAHRASCRKSVSTVASAEHTRPRNSSTAARDPASSRRARLRVRTQAFEAGELRCNPSHDRQQSGAFVIGRPLRLGAGCLGEHNGQTAALRSSPGSFVAGSRSTRCGLRSSSTRSRRTSRHPQWEARYTRTNW